MYWRFWDLSQVDVLMTDVWHTLWEYFMCHWCITDVPICNKNTCKTDVWCQMYFMLNSAYHNFSDPMWLHTLWGIYWSVWDFEKRNWINDWCLKKYGCILFAIDVLLMYQYTIKRYVNPMYRCQLFFMCNSTYPNYFHPTVIHWL